MKLELIKEATNLKNLRSMKIGKVKEFLAEEHYLLIEGHIDIISSVVITNNRNY